MSRFLRLAGLCWVELLLGAALILLPKRLHWSRHSSGVLALAAVALIGARAPVDRPRGAVGQFLYSLSRNRELVVGATLFGVQYLLTEEESSVRGIIAGLGAALMATGLLVRWVVPERLRSADSR